jgi:hypothetical protein
MRDRGLRSQQIYLLAWLEIGWISAIALNALSAQATDLEDLCQKSPFDSQCQAQQVDQRDNAPQVIKLRLTKLSDVSEWVRLEVTGRKVKLLHTTVAPSGFAKALRTAFGIPSSFSDSSAATILGIASALPPIAHTWYDHSTVRVFFQPDGCEGARETTSCVVSGATTLELPEKTVLSKGQFTIEYIESNLQRSVTFRIPQQN